MKRDARSPAAYRNAVEGAQRELLEAVRALVLEVSPDVRETIGHGMLDYPGIANLAAQKHYVSLYVPAAVLDRHRGRFDGISCGRSCVRLRRLAQVDRDALIALLRDALAHESSGPA